MPFGLRRRLRDGGGSHQYQPPSAPPALPPVPYEPTMAEALAVPHLFAPAPAAPAAHVAQVGTPVAVPVPVPVAVPVPVVPVGPVPSPRRAMRPAEALAELSALARSAAKPQVGSGNGGGGP